MNEKPGRQKQQPDKGSVPKPQPPANKPGGGPKKSPPPSPSSKPASGKGGNRSEIA